VLRPRRHGPPGPQPVFAAPRDAAHSRGGGLSSRRTRAATMTLPVDSLSDGSKRTV